MRKDQLNSQATAEYIEQLEARIKVLEGRLISVTELFSRLKILLYEVVNLTSEDALS